MAAEPLAPEIARQRQHGGALGLEIFIPVAVVAFADDAHQRREKALESDQFQ